MKIEIDKPVIPQFVADWIEQLYGQGFNSDDLLEAMFSRNYEVAELKIFEWFTDDKERAVTAVLYGYEVEPEPLYYLYRGWDEELCSDSLDELVCEARELIRKNTGKPLIITNDKNEIIREFAPRLHSFNEPKYSKDFKDYKESMKGLEQ